jgi:deoxyribodipyrimidine photo-lyase
MPKKHKLIIYIKELYLRDFYIQIGYYFNYVFGNNFKDSLKIKWKYNEKLYSAWCNAYIGIPIVDTAIIQLITTGYMHNRCRMIITNLFTRLFHLDWKLGELFFPII